MSESTSPQQTRSERTAFLIRDFKEKHRLNAPTCTSDGSPNAYVDAAGGGVILYCHVCSYREKAPPRE